MDWAAIGYIVLSIIEDAVVEALEKGVEYIIRKGIDSVGRPITEIVYYFDGDGDGVEDESEVLCSFDILIPDLDEGLCICNDGDTVGLGLPQIQLIDGMTITDYVDTLDPNNMPMITGNDDGWLVDMDYDGADDVLVVLPDFTGDGMPDFGWLVDNDDNSLPDVSSDGPFYPIGSDEYETYIKQSGLQSDSIMEKSINDYTVTEGLLFISLLISAVWFFRSIFKREVLF